MQILELNTWHQLNVWLNDSRWREQQGGKPRFAFRGQAKSDWPLNTSLARHFWEHLNAQQTNQWRTRELKMYQMFRERLIKLCPRVYDNWRDRDILALMQHYGVPTRMIDFTYSPRVAAWFALKDSKGATAVWIVDRVQLDDRRTELNLPDYCGPTHIPGYHVFDKDTQGMYKQVGSILDVQPNDRLAAQSGCFFVQGAISRTVEDDLVYEKVVLSEQVAIESLTYLSTLGTKRTLFPELNELAEEAKRFSVTGADFYPIA